MTSKRAERITGLSVRPIQGVRRSYGLYLTEDRLTPLFTATASEPAEALGRLVEWHYDQQRKQVFYEQNYRCWSCFRIAALQCDHIKPRGQGRCDLRTNLRGLCAACHEQHTRNLAILIHPKMIEIMYNVGYRFLGEWVSDLHPYGWGRIA